MAADSKPKQVLDAIVARLKSIAAGETYWYTPQAVGVFPFRLECLDPSLETAYVVEADEAEHLEENTHENRCRMPVIIAGMRRFAVTERVYEADASVPDRATEQSRLEQDLLNRFTGSAADLTLDGLVDNVAGENGDELVVSKQADETFVEGWAIVLFRIVPVFSYMRGQL